MARHRSCRGEHEPRKLLSQNESLVREESARLATELRAILADLPEGAYGLAIGHSPLTECGVYGLHWNFVCPAQGMRWIFDRAGEGREA